jgi:hypothetical protein
MSIAATIAATMAVNGMVRPCWGPASDRSWRGCSTSRANESFAMRQLTAANISLGSLKRRFELRPIPVFPNGPLQSAPACWSPSQMSRIASLRPDGGYDYTLFGVVPPGFRNLTPAPPPFSSMNSTPAACSALCIFSPVSLRPPSGPSLASSRFIAESSQSEI